jgi:hypothetical protein
MDPDADPGGPKNKWILRIWIRIRNTASKIRKYRGEENRDDVSMCTQTGGNVLVNTFLHILARLHSFLSLYVCGKCLEKCQAIDLEQSAENVESAAPNSCSTDSAKFNAELFLFSKQYSTNGNSANFYKANVSVGYSMLLLLKIHIAKVLVPSQRTTQP